MVGRSDPLLGSNCEIGGRWRGYLGRHYGIEFLSSLGLSPETEASTADVAKLIDQVRKENVKIYFIETSNDPRRVQQSKPPRKSTPAASFTPEPCRPPTGRRRLSSDVPLQYRSTRPGDGERVTPTGWKAEMPAARRILLRNNALLAGQIASSSTRDLPC